ncbi:MAG TPA: STELLO glycosyltransferase family protein [Candidatus Saccharimonadales bacterium]|nr:STELLO glycosyltransferase family protein [Candidatus Saccharimonadales bacterium]
MTVGSKFIIITSIFTPTEAVKRFAAIRGWQLVVVGDKKSPSSWHCDNVTFLSAQAQPDFGYKVADILPWNHYCRKMIGYLYAIEHGADVIVDTDDDNIPYQDWAVLPFQKEYQTISAPGFVNIYKYFSQQFIWPRGFPLNKILEDSTPSEQLRHSKVGVWQFLADEDPDVDAIYRLTINQPVKFDKRNPIVLDEQTVCPFNSQNTAFIAELFPLLYLPAFVTFRFTDILRGLVAQPILWNCGYRLGFGGATVVQKRNPHDYLKDFESEIPVYLYAEKIIDIVQAAISKRGTITQNMLAAYESLQKHGIVNSQEIRLLQSWIQDVERLTTTQP